MSQVFVFLTLPLLDAKHRLLCLPHVCTFASTVVAMETKCTEWREGQTSRRTLVLCQVKYLRDARISNVLINLRLHFEVDK